jgi:NADH-quinone oxidoreductase subunit E
MAVRRLAPKEKQPASFAFSAENLTWAKAQIAKYPPGRQASAVIPILWRVQEQHEGWVSEVAIRAVADLLEMPYIRVLEIATFYTMFQLEPVGKKAHVQVCGTTPCMLRGSKDLIEVCKNRIHHDPFHVSADGNFSWEEVECLGACVNAPMVMIWKDTYEDLTPESLGKVLDGFASGNPPKPGPQIDRQFAAPVTGLTSLTSDADNDNKGKTSGSTNGPALTDSEPKKQTESANAQERPAPKPPMGDASKTNPPKGDKS